MKLITAVSGRIIEHGQGQQGLEGRRIRTGIEGLDNFYGSALVRSAVHELLHPTNSARPMFPAMLMAKSAMGNVLPVRDMGGVSLAATPDLSQLPDTREPQGGVIVISDPQRKLYPPAAAQLGIPLARLYLLHPANRQQELWAIGECLASEGVCAVVAELGSLNQVEARRLQLAAERGGTVGLFIRPVGKSSGIYAAATRTLVTPVPATSAAQRWKLTLLHGHGCQVGKSVVLEYNREEHTVHTPEQLADRKSAAKTKVSRAIA